MSYSAAQAYHWFDWSKVWPELGKERWKRSILDASLSVPRRQPMPTNMYALTIYPSFLQIYSELRLPA